MRLQWLLPCFSAHLHFVLEQGREISHKASGMRDVGAVICTELHSERKGKEGGGQRERGGGG